MRLLVLWSWGKLQGDGEFSWGVLSRAIWSVDLTVGIGQGLAGPKKKNSTVVWPSESLNSMQASIEHFLGASGPFAGLGLTISLSIPPITTYLVTNPAPHFPNPWLTSNSITLVTLTFFTFHPSSLLTHKPPSCSLLPTLQPSLLQIELQGASLVSAGRLIYDFFVSNLHYHFETLPVSYPKHSFRGCMVTS